MRFNEWIEESPQRARTITACMAFAGGLLGSFVGSSFGLYFASLALLALLLLGQVAVLYAFYYWRHRRQHH